MRRRELLALAAAAAARAAGQAPDRLDQGPFGIEQDEGWFTIATTTPAAGHVRNFGLGLVGYTWEEGGPSLAARRGQETLERHVEKMAALPMVDVLYIRCDWRDVQQKPGRLDLAPVWKLTLDAARRKNLRVAFRVQLSSPNFQPKQLSAPDFVRDRVPWVDIGRGYREPRYDHPAFQEAFRELNGLLAAEFDSNPLMEWMDLMQYGFWGEGHTSDNKNPFPDYLTARNTFLDMTHRQIEAWKRVPLAVNTQPDISNVGNREVIEYAVREGCWLRSDSVIVEEPEQIDKLANRPPHLAVIMEDGSRRQYSLEPRQVAPDPAGRPLMEKIMLHTLDLGANYWSLWTEADNIARFAEKYPGPFNALQERLGWRVRPSWVWQRKRWGTTELVVCFTNDGVAGVPGTLRAWVETPDAKVKVGGALDAGHPHGGRVRLASFVLPRGLENTKLKLRAEIETNGVRRPVRWACAQPVEADDSFVLQLKPLSDKNWRKGV